MSKKRIEVRTVGNNYEVVGVIPGAGEIVYGKSPNKAGADKIVRKLKANPKTKDYPVNIVKRSKK